MGVLHAFQCKFHGTFEQRVEVKKGVKIPPCPRGCSKSLVTLIFVQAPGHVRPGTKRADKLVREAADLQKLSDISLSPSRSGGTVAERNRTKANLGKQNVPVAAQAQAADFGKYIGAMTNKQNALSDLGIGNKYDPSEWRKDKDSGRVSHIGAQGPREVRPSASVERVRE